MRSRRVAHVHPHVGRLGLQCESRIWRGGRRGGGTAGSRRKPGVPVATPSEPRPEPRTRAAEGGRDKPGREDAALQLGGLATRSESSSFSRRLRPTKMGTPAGDWKTRPVQLRFLDEATFFWAAGLPTSAAAAVSAGRSSAGLRLSCHAGAAGALWVCEAWAHGAVFPHLFRALDELRLQCFERMGCAPTREVGGSESAMLW